jgi:hypothetical protein
MKDRLRPEYDLKSLQVRKLGPVVRISAASVIRLEPDVAEVFPSAESVNETLRFLIRVTKDKKPLLRNPEWSEAGPHFDVPQRSEHSGPRTRITRTVQSWRSRHRHARESGHQTLDSGSR